MRLMHPSSCDTMVALGRVTAQGQTIFAKNSDRPADECQPLAFHPRRSHPPGTTLACQFVELPQAETTWRHIGSRPYWCWGYEHGFNEHQVVIGNEALPSNLPTAQEVKLIGMELLRLGLERGAARPRRWRSLPVWSAATARANLPMRRWCAPTTTATLWPTPR